METVIWPSVQQEQTGTKKRNKGDNSEKYVKNADKGQGLKEHFPDYEDLENKLTELRDIKAVAFFGT